MNETGLNSTKKVEIDLEECCGICQFHRGEMCHRRAPAGGTMGNGENLIIRYDKWPWTSKSDWCGEFEKGVF